MKKMKYILKRLLSDQRSKEVEVFRYVEVNTDLNYSACLILNESATTQSLFSVDSSLDFDLISYSHNGSPESTRFPVKQHYPLVTEFTGESLQRIFELVRPNWDYIGIMFDDIVISSSQLNRVLRIAHTHKLDWFMPAYSSCSHAYFDFLRVRPGLVLHEVPHVEWNCSFFSRRMWESISPHIKGSISGWGYANHICRALSEELDDARIAVIDSELMRHVRPQGKGYLSKRFSNGLTAREEMDLMAKWAARRRVDKRSL